MSMCSKCQGKYNDFAGIKGKLSSALDQTEECKTQTTSTKSTLSSVIISGVSIDKDDTDNINKNLDSISSDLSTMITQCSNEMSRIDAACPGPDHYKPKKTKNTRLNSANK